MRKLKYDIQNNIPVPPVPPIKVEFPDKNNPFADPGHYPDKWVPPGPGHYPDEWEKQTDEKYQLLDPVTEQKNADEYKNISDLFRTTLGVYRIDKIERIQNADLYDLFVLNAMRVARRDDPSAITCKGVTKRLFHGTNAVEQIIGLESNGFLAALAGTRIGKAYGEGSYFARDASYSHNGYARRIAPGIYQLLVVDVVVGKFCLGTSDMKVSPEIRPGTDGQRYDCVVNNIQDPTIFVTFLSGMSAYPSYLITYADGTSVA